ncbi:MAG: ribonuclease HII [Betaproteobacteria bacterium]|nr:ribonuclease HII [Betaproteobacteria bacterium]
MRPERIIRVGQPLDFPAGLLCGVDEAGRGPIAGPVSAAAVMLHPDRPIPGLADSKKLSAGQRATLEQRIKAEALAWSTAFASVAEIDQLNILQATLLAMRRAIEGLGVVPGVVVVDGLYGPVLPMRTIAVVQGDARVAAISAASILAKTGRDRVMEALACDYPQYQFERHKGYPTALHLARLREHGVSPHHRLSFAPVSACRCG